jgi:hypothetical protein
MYLLPVGHPRVLTTSIPSAFPSVAVRETIALASYERSPNGTAAPGDPNLGRVAPEGLKRYA